MGKGVWKLTSVVLKCQMPNRTARERVVKSGQVGACGEKKPKTNGLSLFSKELKAKKIKLVGGAECLKRAERRAERRKQKGQSARKGVLENVPAGEKSPVAAAKNCRVLVSSSSFIISPSSSSTSSASRLLVRVTSSPRRVKPRTSDALPLPPRRALVPLVLWNVTRDAEEARAAEVALARATHGAAATLAESVFTILMSTGKKNTKSRKGFPNFFFFILREELLFHASACIVRSS